MPGRKCSVCSHPSLDKINAMLIQNVSHIEIITVFNDLGDMSLHRHKQNHLPKMLSKAKAAQEIVQSNKVMTELQRCFNRVNLLFDACDRWLRDADDPSRYDIGLRAEEVKVTYFEPGQDGDMGRLRKASLAHLLAKIEGGGYQVEGWGGSRTADPRELILKTATRLQGQIELLAKLTGELAPERILIQAGPVIDQIVFVLRQEIRDPEALQRVSQRLLLEAAKDVGTVIDV